MASNVNLAGRFDVSGPAHIMSRATAGCSSSTMIDWNSEEDRRCVVACVVNGTYILEDDRSNCRVQARALAPAWWESFQFRLVDVLTDESFKRKGDVFIFGAIYEHVPSAGAPRHPSAPQYIVAFRGTMLNHSKWIQDIYLDLKIMANTLSGSNRSQRAHEAVATLIATKAKGKGGSETCAVWLTGHSLGASLALEVGRAMMDKQGLNLPTFLFNPPLVSLGSAVNMLLPSEGLKRKLHATTNLVKAGIGMVLCPHGKRMEGLFQRLSPWAPNLYVHEKDLVSQGFIDYFERRQQLHERFSAVAKSAMTLSYHDMILSALGKEKEGPHLLPSATLCKNSGMDKGVDRLQMSLAAHELQQWWKPDGELRLINRRFSFP